METPVHAPFKEKLRIEITKLRSMSFKEKIEYIWEYYKLLLVGIFVFLLILGSIIYATAINPSPQTALFAEWSAGFVTSDQLDVLSGVLTENLVGESENKVATVSLFFDSAEDPQMLMAMMGRRIAMISVGELDVVIQSSEQLIENASHGMLLPIEAVLDEIRVQHPAFFNVLDGRLISAWYDPLDEGGEYRILGVDISESPLLEDLGFHKSEFIFSFVANSNRIETSINALMLLLSGVE